MAKASVQQRPPAAKEIPGLPLKNFQPKKINVTNSRTDPLKLQENDLAAVRALAKRYAEVDRHMPFVASITITPIAKG
jgi:hypothetical protein